ncbi:MAG TPA: hypothetical protein VFW65_18155 [Pseudonocardiaceae bacterium]|nr:hypothetical protein [Pseudonocardiaceae bacterium]
MTAGRGGVVPYVAVWSDERTVRTTVVQRGRWGIGYADEVLTDRDRDGVLWTRTVSRPGHGRPLYAKLHPLRQRRAMRRLLCQVCGQPADYTDQGHLWLAIEQQEKWPGWPENSINPFPPLCLGCAVRSVRLCPPLRRGFVAFRAHSTLYGVIGVRFRSGPTYPAVALAADDGGVPVAFTDPAIHWMQAAQLTRTMHQCVPVDLDRLAS